MNIGENLLTIFCLETGIKASSFLHPLEAVDPENPLIRFAEILKKGSTLNPPNMWAYGTGFDKVPYNSVCFYWKDGKVANKFVNWLAHKRIKTFSRNIELTAIQIMDSSVEKFLSDPKVMENIRGAYVGTKIGVL